MAISAYSQTPAEEYEQVSKLFPKQDFVVLELNRSYDMKLNKDTIAIEQVSSETDMYMSDNALLHAKRSFTESEYFPLQDKEAYSYIPNGKKYNQVEVTDFSYNDFDDNSVFIDDVREVSFQYPNLVKGSKSSLFTKYTVKDPHVLPVLTVNPYVAAKKVVFTVTHDKNIQLQFIPINMDSTDFEYKVDESRKRIQHTWVFKDIKPLKSEPGAPGYLHFAKRLAVLVNSYKTKDGKETIVLRNLDDLKNWYCGLVQDVLKAPNDELLELADSLTEGMTDTLKMINTLYGWVQHNVSYIAIEQGIKGFVPQEAIEVCRNRYGDCKGMSNLLYNLLKAKNIRADLAWVGTRKMALKYTQIPSPAVDNHMIVVCDVGDQTYFLDPTHDNLPLGLVSPFIQGKQVLRTKECSTYEILTAPAAKPEDNLVIDSVWAKLEDKTLVGTGVSYFHGYNRMYIASAITSDSYQDLFDLTESLLELGNNSFLLDTVWLDKPEDKSKPIKFGYKFTIPNYAIAIDDEMYVNLNLEKSLIDGDVKEDRKLPLEYNFQQKEVYYFSLDLDNAYEVVEMPEKIDTEWKYSSFQSEYKIEGNKVIVNTSKKDHTLIVEVSDIKEYNKYNTAVRKYCASQITLKKKPGQ